MSVKKLIELKTKLEESGINCVDYLTDGDEDLFDPIVAEIIGLLEEFNREDWLSLKSHGISLIAGECLCIYTKKGIINSGIDNIWGIC